ncbi:ATP-binding protein [Deinococcus ruber]|uniref:histidine kinase n=1 Tax=Deinococcus ruber TaxID=1848197 RepID=A0A918KXC8_9DEIO|nr:ATP-binding protein [Deinococcus ruber]GGR39115.1 hypothetical protein GCM10008957_55070 [Deinococcus ruber]
MTALSTGPDHVFQGGGEMGAMMRTFDWTTTPLGPSQTWPPELRTLIRLMLAAQQPMFIGWSRDLISLYNDAYSQFLGPDKHPHALGTPLAAVFAEDAYPQLKPVFEALMTRGEAVAFEGAPVPLVRFGYLEETFFDFGYTPVSSEGGEIKGMFVACTESTEGVLASRRTLTLAQLASTLIGAQDADQIAQVALATLAQNSHDVPFALLYLSGETGTLTLKATMGLTDTLLDQPWPVQDVFQTQTAQWTQDLGPISAGPWPEAVTEVAALPLVPADGHAPALGVLVVGVNARKRLDGPYRDFLALLAQQLSSALERSDQARQLEEHRAELEARTKALESFATLTRDLGLHEDPSVLVQRAQQVMLSLLPEGYTLYFEPEGDRWVLRAQTGDVRSEALQAVADAGLPYHEARNLLLPYTTLAPYYQDRYARDTDNISELVAHIGASATFPVMVDGRPRGVVAVVLFGERRPWKRTEKAVMESVTRSLSLTLEGIEARRNFNRTQHYLKVVADHAPILLFATDAQGVFTLSEGSLLTKLDLQSAQAVGHSATALFAHEAELREGRRLNRALAGEDTHDLIHFGAQGVTLETWFIPVKNAAGDVTEVVGVSLDVTERLEGQRQVVQANEELRRSNAELEQFAYVASHDLQEPLRTVTSFSQLLVSKYRGQLDAKGDLYLRLITEGAERMAQLLQDLLAFSQVTRDAKALGIVDSAVIVRQVVQDLDALIKRTEAEVEVRGLPRVFSDASQLRQVFQNLLGNALKFNAPNRKPRVRVEAVRNGGLWRFAVSDNGVGIQSEFFERIFTIFQRLHTREKYEGNGIGLAITRKIIERQGGHIWVESTPDAGTTFFFTLVASEDHE